MEAHVKLPDNWYGYVVIRNYDSDEVVEETLHAGLEEFRRRGTEGTDRSRRRRKLRPQRRGIYNRDFIFVNLVGYLCLFHLYRHSIQVFL